MWNIMGILRDHGVIHGIHGNFMVSCSILWWLIFKQINMFKREKGKMKNPRTQTELLTVSVPLFDSAAINWLSSPHSSITLSLFLFLIIVRLNYLDIQMLYFISFCIHDTIMGYHRFFPHCHCCTAVRISAVAPLLLGFKVFHMTLRKTRGFHAFILWLY